MCTKLQEFQTQLNERTQPGSHWSLHSPHAIPSKRFQFAHFRWKIGVHFASLTLSTTHFQTLWTTATIKTTSTIQFYREFYTHAHSQTHAIFDRRIAFRWNNEINDKENVQIWLNISIIQCKLMQINFMPNISCASFRSGNEHIINT